MEKRAITLDLFFLALLFVTVDTLPAPTLPTLHVGTMSAASFMYVCFCALILILLLYHYHLNCQEQRKFDDRNMTILAKRVSGHGGLAGVMKGVSIDTSVARHESRFDPSRWK